MQVRFCVPQEIIQNCNISKVQIYGYNSNKYKNVNKLLL